jgi:tRNA A37 threonylcarbamoyladenosine modification protein TsaB
LRAGIAFVRGVCARSQARFRGVPSSLALARQAAAEVTTGGRIGVLHDGRQGTVLFTPFVRTADDEAGIPRVRQAADPAVVTAVDLAATLAPCVRLITADAAEVMAVCPDAYRDRLQCVAAVDARLLLDPPGVGWPDTAADAAAGCTPVYVRPAVFVAPVVPRTLAGTDTPGDHAPAVDPGRGR